MEERHTQVNIASPTPGSRDILGIENKVNAVVHDGASNRNEAGHLNNWVDVGCVAHKLHLCVTKAMGIDKVTNSQISK